MDIYFEDAIKVTCENNTGIEDQFDLKEVYNAYYHKEQEMFYVINKQGVKAEYLKERFACKFDLRLMQFVRELKREIKELAKQQKETKLEFRKARSEWDKVPSEKKNWSTYPRSFEDRSIDITTKQIIYGLLRGKSHLNKEATEKYYKNRGWLYGKLRRELIARYGYLIEILPEQP